MLGKAETRDYPFYGPCERPDPSIVLHLGSNLRSKIDSIDLNPRVEKFAE